MLQSSTDNSEDEKEGFFGNGEESQLEAPSDETEIDITSEILIMLALLMTAITLGHFLKKTQHKYLQESGLTVILGVLAGALFKLLSMETYLTNLSKHFGNLFMILLLPPIIFDSGFNMNKKPFLANFGTVLAYSFLGTFIAIFTSSILFRFVGQTSLSPEFSWKESFAFGSLISATDPVSVLAIFKEMDADVNLFAIVFGESIFNDAIGIVMYETVLKMGAVEGRPLSEEIFLAASEFFLIFTGSLLIGAIFALCISYLLKRQSQVNGKLISQDKENNQPNFQQQQQQQKGTTAEISLMVMCPWICYLIAEGLGLSGIVAICTNGVFLNYYAQHNVSRASRRVLKLTYETVAATAEQIVFLFLGIGLFAFNHPFEKMGWGLTLTTILNLNFARFLNILITTSLVNCTRATTKIPFKMQFVMWIAGLRGAMAYALALKCATDLEIGPVILIDTLIYAFITILGVGTVLNPILSKLGVKRKDDEIEPNEEGDVVQNAQVGIRNGFSVKVKNFIGRIDQKYISPTFINIELREKQLQSKVNLDDTFAEVDSPTLPSVASMGSSNEEDAVQPQPKKKLIELKELKGTSPQKEEIKQGELQFSDD